MLRIAGGLRIVWSVPICSCRVDVAARGLRNLAEEVDRSPLLVPVVDCAVVAIDTTPGKLVVGAGDFIVVKVHLLWKWLSWWKGHVCAVSDQPNSTTQLNSVERLTTKSLE